MSDVYHPFNKYLLNPDHVPSSVLHENHTYSEPGKQLAKPFFPVLVYVTPRLPQFQGNGRLEQKVELEPDNSKGYHDSSIENEHMEQSEGRWEKSRCPHNSSKCSAACQREIITCILCLDFICKMGTDIPTSQPARKRK